MHLRLPVCFYLKVKSELMGKYCAINSWLIYTRVGGGEGICHFKVTCLIKSVVPFPAEWCGARAALCCENRTRPACLPPLRLGRATFFTQLSLYHSAGYNTCGKSIFKKLMIFRGVQMSISYKSNRDPAQPGEMHFLLVQQICSTNKICISPRLCRISIFTQNLTLKAYSSSEIGFPKKFCVTQM